MSYGNRGEEVVAQASSADASAGDVEFTYHDGSIVRTIAATEVLMVTDFTIVSAAGGAIAIMAVDNVATPTITLNLFAGTVAANSIIEKPMETPFQVPEGFTLVVLAPLGQVDAQIHGFVIH